MTVPYQPLDPTTTPESDKNDQSPDNTLEEIGDNNGEKEERDSENGEQSSDSSFGSERDGSNDSRLIIDEASI